MKRNEFFWTFKSTFTLFCSYSSSSSCESLTKIFNCFDNKDTKICVYSFQQHKTEDCLMGDEALDDVLKTENI